MLAVSAVTGRGIDALKRALFDLVPGGGRRRLTEEVELADFLVYRPRPPRRRPFRIFRTARGYRVRGQATEDELRARRREGRTRTSSSRTQ